MTDAYKLTCPNSEDGAHEWKHHQCMRCGTAFDSPYECEFANAAAREIKRMEELNRTIHATNGILSNSLNGMAKEIAELRLAAEHYNKQHDEHVAQIRKEYEETVDELRAQLAESSAKIDSLKTAISYDLSNDLDREDSIRELIQECGGFTKEHNMHGIGMVEVLMDEFRNRCEQLARVRVSPVPSSEARERQGTLRDAEESFLAEIETDAARSRLEGE